MEKSTKTKANLFQLDPYLMFILQIVTNMLRVKNGAPSEFQVRMFREL